MMSTNRLKHVLMLFAALLLACAATSGSALAQAEGGLLPVTQAFQLKATSAGPGKIHLHWTIADHYYLYRGRIHVKALGTAATLGTLALPPGLAEHDPYLGNVVIYHHKIDATQPYTLRNADAKTLRLAVTYQGCHEVAPKICYPPHTQNVDITVVGTAATTHAFGASGAPPGGNGGLRAATLSAPAAGAAPQSAVSKLASSLSGSGRWLALLGFFAAGLALAFTPCVLPMIPILSGLVAGAGAGKTLSTARAFWLSLVYVLASSVVFVIAGIVAGLIGASVQAAFQAPWLLTAFAVVFVLLALSMFGFYELKPPAALQKRITHASNRQAGGSLVGVAVMGVLSALIVGPCVAPPLAGAVLYIAQSHDPVFGALALWLLALGMGVPLLVFGTAAGRWLPHAGPWMRKVQAVFGVVFLALAVWMLARFLVPLWIMLMSAALMIGSGVYLGALTRLSHRASGWRRLWQTCGVMLVIAGGAELVGVGAGSNSLLTPLAGLSGRNVVTAQSAPAFAPVTSLAGLDQALANARAIGQPVMLDFYADWCTSCKEMEHLTYTQPQVAAMLRNFTLLQVDVTANTAADRALLKHYGLFGPPATIFYTATGRQLTGLQLVGYENASKFRTRLAQVEGS